MNPDGCISSFLVILLICAYDDDMVCHCSLSPSNHCIFSFQGNKIRCHVKKKREKFVFFALNRHFLRLLLTDSLVSKRHTRDKKITRKFQLEQNACMEITDTQTEEVILYLKCRNVLLFFLFAFVEDNKIRTKKKIQMLGIFKSNL